jgi:tetratricopeptide (TPR) repeat protein
MIEDIVTIRPETKRNYYTEKLEFAFPVKKPREKAKYFFQWGLIYHAKGKPAEAYKYYEKALVYHKFPLYLKQMGILHHEMGYFKDALKYLRAAHKIEQDIQEEKQRKILQHKKETHTLVEQNFHYNETTTEYAAKYHSNFSDSFDNAIPPE